MASNWTTQTLGAIANGAHGLVDGPFGSSLPASDYTEHGVPVIRGSNLSLGEARFNQDRFVYVSWETAERLSRSLCEPDDIIFTKKGTIGQTGIIPKGTGFDRFLLSSNQMKLTVDRSKAIPLFVYYYVSSKASREKILQDASVTGVPKINLAYLRTFPIALPPIDEQERIVESLGALDERIECLRKSNTALEAIAQGIFQSWFVDFDPVQAKAEGRDPEGMDAATAVLFPFDFDETEYGAVPFGWSLKSLTEFMFINPPRSLPKGKEAPYLEMANAPTTGPRPSQWINRLPISGCRFRNGDTLLAKITPCLENGKAAFVDFLDEDAVGWGSTEFVVLAPKGPIPAVFGYLLARDKAFRAYAIQSMSGTSGRQRVQVDQLGKFKFAVATDAVYEAFGKIVDPLFAAISHNDDQTKTLAEIRDTLLPRLISGRLQIPEAETLLEAVL